MLVLVTGIAGFIGYHAAEALLARGDEVIGLDNLNAYYDPALKAARLSRLEGRKGFSFVFADIARFKALRAALAKPWGEIAGVLHLAAQAGVRHSLDHPLDYGQANLLGHLNMLEIARHLPALRHMVYASSSSVYGASQRLPFALDDPADRPNSLYAATKRAAELMSESYARLHRLPLTGLRFFTVYGPWGRPDMAYIKFARAILADAQVELFGDGTQSRDFTYIDDIVAGLLAAFDRPPVAADPPHRLYNLGGDRPSSLAHLLEKIAEACGRKARIKYLPTAPGDLSATWADISASRRDLGFSPQTPLEIGIPRIVDWVRDYYRLA